jgi:hypothetical protein
VSAFVTDLLLRAFKHSSGFTSSLSSFKFTPLANAIGPVMVKALVPRRPCRQYQR